MVCTAVPSITKVRVKVQLIFVTLTNIYDTLIHGRLEPEPDIVRYGDQGYIGFELVRHQGKSSRGHVTTRGGVMDLASREPPTQML